MDRPDRFGGLLSVAAAFAVALVLTPVVRSVTIGLDHTLGQAWPFSLAHCHVRATPGCAEAERARLLAAR